MKMNATALVLLALVCLVPLAGAEPPPAAPAAGAAEAAPALPMDAAEFLATLATDPSDPPEALDLSSGPQAPWTTCTSNADCPSGELCCYPCGIDGCEFVCMTPVKRRCPLFV